METLGPYQILRELGRGGFGAVYLALDPRIGRKVAIKTVLPVSDSNLSEALRARFRREAKAAGGLSHPNIVTVHEYDDSASLAYLVMEYVEGCTLSQKMESGAPLSLEFALSVLAPAAAALDYAHSRNVVHRDVKPANFLIADNGPVKIADFGIAKIMDADTGGLTSTGTVVGTAHYMSPEQVAAKPVDGRSDQFSLAVIAYEILTGRKPFQGDSWASVLHQIMSTDPAPVRQFREDLADSVTGVLQKALAKEAADRYPNCESFVRELRDAAGNMNAGQTLPLPAGLAAKIGVPAAQVDDSEATIAFPPPRFPPQAANRPPAPPGNPSGVWAAVWKGAAAVALLAAGVMGYRLWVSRPAPDLAIHSIIPGRTAEPAAAQPAVNVPDVKEPTTIQPAKLSPPAPGASARKPSAAPPPNPAAQPDPRALESEAWEQVRSSTDIAALERFRAAFPNGSFAAEAGRRIEQLEYEQASLANTAKAYRDFLAKYPAGPYAERATAELAKGNRNGQIAATRRLVDAALQTYRQAFERKDIMLLKSVWPGLSSADLTSIQTFFRIARTVKLELQVTGDPDMSADGAAVRCRRILTATDDRGPLPSQDQEVAIRLRKSGDAMLIESVQVLKR